MFSIGTMDNKALALLLLVAIINGVPVQASAKAQDGPLIHEEVRVTHHVRRYHAPATPHHHHFHHHANLDDGGAESVQQPVFEALWLQQSKPSEVVDERNLPDFLELPPEALVPKKKTARTNLALAEDRDDRSGIVSHPSTSGSDLLSAVSERLINRRRAALLHDLVLAAQNQQQQQQQQQQEPTLLDLVLEQQQYQQQEQHQQQQQPSLFELALEQQRKEYSRLPSTLVQEQTQLQQADPSLSDDLGYAEQTKQEYANVFDLGQDQNQQGHVFHPYGLYGDDLERSQQQTGPVQQLISSRQQQLALYASSIRSQQQQQQQQHGLGTAQIKQDQSQNWSDRLRATFIHPSSRFQDDDRLGGVENRQVQQFQSTAPAQQFDGIRRRTVQHRQGRPAAGRILHSSLLHDLAYAAQQEKAQQGNNGQDDSSGQQFAPDDQQQQNFDDQNVFDGAAGADYSSGDDQRQSQLQQEQGQQQSQPQQQGNDDTQGLAAQNPYLLLPSMSYDQDLNLGHATPVVQHIPGHTPLVSGERLAEQQMIDTPGILDVQGQPAVRSMISRQRTTLNTEYVPTKKRTSSGGLPAAAVASSSNSSRRTKSSATKSAKRMGKPSSSEVMPEDDLNKNTV